MRPRPSPATAISLVALVIAMSGTAYAATGGSFILGRANRASTVSSLSNRNGIALSLSSKHGKPPLTVSNSVQVPNLDASKLGGIPAGKFMAGTGRAGSVSVNAFGVSSVTLLRTATSTLVGECDQLGQHGAYLVAQTVSDATTTWWNANGVNSSTGTFPQLTPQSTLDFMVIAQVSTGKTVSTYTASQTYDSGNDECVFTAQVVTTTG